MNTSLILIIIMALALIIGGIMLLKQSAKKFNLSEEQLKKVKKRKAELEKEELKKND